MQRSPVLPRRPEALARPSPRAVTHVHVHEHVAHQHTDAAGDEYIHRLYRHEHDHGHGTGEHGHDAAEPWRRGGADEAPVTSSARKGH